MDCIKTYLDEVNRIYGRGNATEHAYRAALGALVEGLKKGVVVNGSAVGPIQMKQEILLAGNSVANVFKY